MKLILAALLAFSAPAPAVEISTGKMLGKSYDTR
jgi:hypothetical protein